MRMGLTIDGFALVAADHCVLSSPPLDIPISGERARLRCFPMACRPGDGGDHAGINCAECHCWKYDV